MKLIYSLIFFLYLNYINNKNKLNNNNVNEILLIKGTPNFSFEKNNKNLTKNYLGLKMFKKKKIIIKNKSIKNFRKKHMSNKKLSKKKTKANRNNLNKEKKIY